MIGSAMVTIATELFCLNKLLENVRYFHVVFLSVDLRLLHWFCRFLNNQKQIYKKIH
jgi:hypothetical protein